MPELTTSRTWTTRFPSGSDYVAVVTTCAGLVSFAFAISDDIVVLWLVGLWFIGGASRIVFTPWRRVTVDSSGTAVFARRAKTFTVEPGALGSITKPPVLRFNPVMSMRVTSVNGRIKYRAPVGSCEELWSALAAANPRAQLMSPHPWIYLKFSRRH